jgi:hypothetical protein
LVERSKNEESDDGKDKSESAHGVGKGDDAGSDDGLNDDCD